MGIVVVVYGKICGKIKKLSNWNKNLCGSRYLAPIMVVVCGSSCSCCKNCGKKKSGGWSVKNTTTITTTTTTKTLGHLILEHGGQRPPQFLLWIRDVLSKAIEKYNPCLQDMYCQLHGLGSNSR